MSSYMSDNSLMLLCSSKQIFPRILSLLLCLVLDYQSKREVHLSLQIQKGKHKLAKSYFAYQIWDFLGCMYDWVGCLPSLGCPSPAFSLFFCTTKSILPSVVFIKHCLTNQLFYVAFVILLLICLPDVLAESKLQLWNTGKLNSRP